MDESVFAAVNIGRAVMAADESVIVDIAKEAIVSGKSVTFYLNETQTQALREWYAAQAPDIDRAAEEMSSEEKERIRTELGVTQLESFRITRLQCPNCGHPYGAFEFLQQAIQAHGLEMINAVFAQKETAITQVNPKLDLTCPNCQTNLVSHEASPGADRIVLSIPGYTYCCPRYGCCVAFPQPIEA